MEPSVFESQERLSKIPAAKGGYILYRRIKEHGLRPTWLWLKDKLTRRIQGFSPPEITRVAPHLYVGGQHRRSGLNRMRRLGIAAIVNMREESDDAARGVDLGEYLWLPTTDDAAPPPETLARGAAFIEEQIKAGRDVYVHCASGVGRAPTMAAAYLVWKGADPDEAWQTIEEGRPFIRPTTPQLEAVRSFAQMLDRGELAETSAPDAIEPQEVVAASLSADSQAVDASAQASASSAREGKGVMQERLQLAYEQIAGDPHLTADLTDDDATILLGWAQNEIERLVNATASMDEDEARQFLDPKIRHLRQYLRRIAKESAAAHDTTTMLRAKLTSPTYPES